ncbi:MAG: MotA/TolQ/ExbB proton channel family protein [Proteobacteria bacterium]|nr:MotA/TolQ/ExbB proton channel family protein [Pseudomonadota bacterium]
MTPYNVAQLVVAAVVCGTVVQRLLVILYRAPIELEPYLNRLGGRLGEGDLEGAKTLAEAGGSSWVALLAGAMVRAKMAGEDPGAARDSVWAELRDEGGKGLHAIRGLSSIASAIGLLGVIVEFRHVYSADGDSALPASGLQAQALQHAAVTMALGLVTSLVGYSALRVLRRHLRRLAQDLKRAARSLDEQLVLER